MKESCWYECEVDVVEESVWGVIPNGTKADWRKLFG